MYLDIGIIYGFDYIFIKDIGCGIFVCLERVYVFRFYIIVFYC